MPSKSEIGKYLHYSHHVVYPEQPTIRLERGLPVVLRGCPRCHGDLLVDREADGWWSCLLCGRAYKGVAA